MDPNSSNTSCTNTGLITIPLQFQFGATSGVAILHSEFFHTCACFTAGVAGFTGFVVFVVVVCFRTGKHTATLFPNEHHSLSAAHTALGPGLHTLPTALITPLTCPGAGRSIVPEKDKVTVDQKVCFDVRVRCCGKYSMYALLHKLVICFIQGPRDRK